MTHTHPNKESQEREVARTLGYTPEHKVGSHTEVGKDMVRKSWAQTWGRPEWEKIRSTLEEWGEEVDGKAWVEGRKNDGEFKGITRKTEKNDYEYFYSYK